jgi:NAD(P)-dependent dehydrogenase (short-subunit alcohol dehydrogenase family)
MTPKVSAEMGERMTDVVVVTGIGGMGAACARRLGSGRKLVVADFDASKLEDEAKRLRHDGFDVVAQPVDISDPLSVGELASTLEGMGPLRTLVHTAGLSPTMASPGRILEVDMLGMDYVLTSMFPLAHEGTVAVCIASMAGYLSGLPAAQQHALATAPTDELVQLVGNVDDLPFGTAYCIAKRVNQLRVEQAATAWGKKGARVVSISPGVISTSMSRQEIEQGDGAAMQQQLDLSPIHRMGTADDIASAVEWLASPAASFITGCDLRVDGGVTAAISGLGPMG